MGLTIVRITSDRKAAEMEARAINRNLMKRKIKREARVISISRDYVKRRTRKGFIVPKRNYAIAMRDKR